MEDTLARQLVDNFQQDMPLTSRPWQAMAEALGTTEEAVMATLEKLLEEDVISRVGPVFDHAKAGASILVAVAAPPARLAEVASEVNGFEGVNHNYARDHQFNLWFVVTAPDKERLKTQLDEIEDAIGLRLLRLPMEMAYHIDLGFQIAWQGNDDEDE